MSVGKLSEHVSRSAGDFSCKLLEIDAKVKFVFMGSLKGGTGATARVVIKDT